MKCRKAFDLDLADFVIDPGAEEWAAFRAHYTSCEDCAAEVAVWDEMQAFLRSGGPGATAHPPKELLLRYEEQRSTLSAIEAATLEKHLAICRTCPEELAAIRSFDFSVVRRRPSPRPQSWRRLALDVVSTIRPVVLHPAFAYALVLIVAYPALIQPRLADRGLPAERVALELANESESAPAEPRSLREDPPSERSVASEARQRIEGDSQLAAASTPPRHAPSLPEQTPGPVSEKRSLSRLARPGKVVVGEVPALAKRDTPPREVPTDRVANSAPAIKEPIVAQGGAASDEVQETEGSDALVHEDPSDADSDDPHVLGFADTEEPRDTALSGRRAQATHEDARNRASWQAIVLAPGHTPEVQLADLVTGVALGLPSTDHNLEVRVVGPGGREVAREAFHSASAEPVEVRIRASELVAGTYRVLTRSPDRSASPEQSSELGFIVH